MRRILRAVRVISLPLWFEALLLMADADHEMKLSNRSEIPAAH